MRLKTPVVKIGNLDIGGNHPVAIQSMTNTDTADTKATAAQILELATAGSELVRVTVNDGAAAQAIPQIRQILDANGFSALPLVGDFHFNGDQLLEQFPAMASALDKYRINPGNVSYGKVDDKSFATIIKIAASNNKPVRIGVNAGSLDQKLLTNLMGKNSRILKPKPAREVKIKAMVKSALLSGKKAISLGLKKNQIVLSVKMSDLEEMLKAYKLLVREMTRSQQLYCLHLGLTEAGAGTQGIVSSSAALAILLNQGIGDTIRISLTPEPQASRTLEVEACKTLLQSLGLRNFQPKITSCPGCGRTDNQLFQSLASEIRNYIAGKMELWREQSPKLAQLKIAVMGCTVNGPGESREADIAISLPGKTEKPMALVFIGGKRFKTLTGSRILEEFIAIIEAYISKHN